MDEEPRIPWLNVWMIFLSVAGLWLTIRQLINMSQPVETQPGMWTASERPEMWISGALTALLLLIVGVVGAVRWPKSLQSEDRYVPGSGLEDTTSVYLTAWRTLWRQKWILGIFGVMAGVRLVGGLIEITLGNLTMVHGLNGAANPPASDLPWYDPLLTAAWSTILYARNAVLGYFIPQAEPGPAMHWVALAALVGLWWAWKHLKALSSDPEYAQDAGYLRALVPPVAVICAAEAIRGVLFLLLTSSLLLKISSPERVRSAFEVTLHAEIKATGFAAVGATILYVVVSGVIFSGLAVSLGRVKRGEPVTGGTFVRDVVRYFKPVAGVYLILGLVALLIAVPFIAPVYLQSGLRAEWPSSLYSLGGSALAVWSVLALLLMLAPYAVVFRDTSSWRAVKQSIRDWLRKPWEALAFFAVGYSLLIVPALLLQIAWQFLGKWGRWRVPYEWLHVLVSAFLIAYMAVAVWEFYWKITRPAEHAKPDIAHPVT